MEQKEAAGGYRSRELEEGPGRKRAAGEGVSGSRRKQQEAIKVEALRSSQPKESCGGSG